MTNDWLEPAGKRAAVYCECNQTSQRDAFWTAMELLLAARCNRVFLGVLPNGDGIETIEITRKAYPDADLEVMVKVNQANQEPRLITPDTTPEEAAQRLKDWMSTANLERVGLDLEQAYRDMDDGAWSLVDLSDFAQAMTDRVSCVYPTISSNAKIKTRRVFYTDAWRAAGVYRVFDNVTRNSPGNEADAELQKDGACLREWLGPGNVTIVCYFGGTYRPIDEANIKAALASGFEVSNEVVLNPGHANIVEFAKALAG